jgi:hypothetical protein
VRALKSGVRRELDSDFEKMDDFFLWKIELSLDLMKSEAAERNEVRLLHDAVIFASRR